MKTADEVKLIIEDMVNQFPEPLQLLNLESLLQVRGALNPSLDLAELTDQMVAEGRLTKVHYQLESGLQRTLLLPATVRVATHSKQVYFSPAVPPGAHVLVHKN